MKLAEALQERADLNRRIQQLQHRLTNNAIVQEGEYPAEDPQDLLDELDRDVDRLEELTAAINLTNCRTLYEGESLTALIARRDCLRLRLEILRDFISEASQNTRRARGSEIRVLSTVNVKNLQRETDELSRDLRLLDNAIQATNWSTEL
ncbi:MAG: DIP1984 family protein [Clostridia bacterium]|nr:DIP1984 family protein [Clostridia bacterium]